MSKLEILIDGQRCEVEVERTINADEPMYAWVDGKRMCIELPQKDVAFQEIEWLIVDGKSYEVVFDHDLKRLEVYGRLHQVDVRDLEAVTVQTAGGDGRVKAPIPGLITRIFVEEGQSIQAGDPLVVLEAMKMENEIVASVGGCVAAVRIRPNDSVLRGDVLVEIR